MSEPVSSSEQNEAVPPSAEAIFSFMQEMSDGDVYGYDVPLTEGEWHQSFISYGVTIPPHRVPDVGYDNIHIYAKSPGSSEYQSLAKVPNQLIGGIGLQALKEFHPIDLATDLAEQYYIVPKSEDGDLKIMKRISEEEAKVLSAETQAEPGKPKLLQRILGRLGLSREITLASPPESMQEVAGKPVIDVEPAEMNRLFELMQESVHYRDATS